MTPRPRPSRFVRHSASRKIVQTAGTTAAAWRSQREGIRFGRAKWRISRSTPAVRISCFERDGQSDRITDFRSVYFEATLDEAQEVPPNTDLAGIDGTGTGVLNFARDGFEFSLDINGIDLDGRRWCPTT